MNQMMLLAETEMRTTLNYGRKNYVSPEVRVMSFGNRDDDCRK